MRADGFCREFVPYAERYGMNDQQILNCYAGPNRADLPAAWNALPAQELVEDPKLIHWADERKRWGAEYVLCLDVWKNYEDRVWARHSRAGHLTAE